MSASYHSHRFSLCSSLCGFSAAVTPQSPSVLCNIGLISLWQDHSLWWLSLSLSAWGIAALTLSDSNKRQPLWDLCLPLCPLERFRRLKKLLELHECDINTPQERNSKQVKPQIFLDKTLFNLFFSLPFFYFKINSYEGLTLHCTEINDLKKMLASATFDCWDLYLCYMPVTTTTAVWCMPSVRRLTLVSELHQIFSFRQPCEPKVTGITKFCGATLLELRLLMHFWWNFGVTEWQTHDSYFIDCCLSRPS